MTGNEFGVIFLVLIALIACWLLPSLCVVPFVAKRKGYPWGWWVLLALMCSPIVALLALAALPDPVHRRAVRRIARRLTPPPPTNRTADRLLGPR